MALTGYREHAHTADWELEVWAPDLPGLLEAAARGMYTISGTRLSASPRQSRTLELNAIDAENLLVRFLSELLWLGQQTESETGFGLAFDTFQLSVEQTRGEHHPLEQSLRLHARLQGTPIAGVDKEIKAVTYHNLAIRQGQRGLEANLVFDV